jgi:hypothetical protein
MPRTAIATYRCPREGNQPSRLLGLFQDGLTFTMLGGRYGRHEIHAGTCAPGDAERRVIAHWEGYVSATRGRATRPARPRFLDFTPAPIDTILLEA